MGVLENLPNEVFIQIAQNLVFEDLQTCRLVSPVMRERIDQLFSAQWCAKFDENSEQDFVAKKKPPLPPPFTRMKIGNVSYFGRNETDQTRKVLKLRKEYFENLSELEITEFVPKPYFDEMINLGKNLRVLKLGSAVLGGIPNIFGKDILRQNNSMKSFSRRMLFLRRALPQTLIHRLQREQVRSRSSEPGYAKKWSTLNELHIIIDYICPSMSSFSPHWLVENLRAIKYLPVPNLSMFTVSVEKSKDAEMFYFTINSLLDTIPLMAYPSLKSVSVVSPKCRPAGQAESFQNKRDFSQMQLSELTVRISEGHTHAIPNSLLAILETQQQSIKSIFIDGIRNAQILQLFF